MTTVTATAEGPVVVPETTSQKIVRFLGKTPVYIALIFLGLLWLVPTLGLLLTSLVVPAEIGSVGWWEIFSRPSLATLDNYGDILRNEAVTSAIWTTVWISLGATIIPIIVAALAGYAFAGSSSRVATGSSSQSSRCSSCQSRWHSSRSSRCTTTSGSSTPSSGSSSSTPRSGFRSRSSCSELLHRYPEGPHRGSAHRRRLGVSDLRPRDPSARAPCDRLARHLPVPLGLERPSGRAHLRPGDAADYGRDLLPAPLVGANLELIAPAAPSCSRSLAGVLRLPAPLLRAGAPGGVSEVATWIARAQSSAAAWRASSRM